MEVVTSATDALSLHDALPISADVILFVSGGPNTRNDFHVNPTEELFYQLKGDIAVRVRPLDGSRPKDVVETEGELRSEQHTSKHKSLTNLVCHLLLEKKTEYR